MCYNCRPDQYNPNCFDPLREGVEMQRLTPQVERLVIYAERVGRLDTENRHLARELSRKESEVAETTDQLQRTKRELNYARNDLEEVVKERDSALRRIPKKPKVTKKGKK